MKDRIAIIGAGILGRLMALHLRQDGWDVDVFDSGNEMGSQSCSHAAAGMLAPTCELDSAEPILYPLGTLSLSRWESLLSAFERPVFFQKKGTLIVAHSTDHRELPHFKNKVKTYGKIKSIDKQHLLALEPELGSKFATALFAEEEGQLDNRQLLRAVLLEGKEHAVRYHFNQTVEQVLEGTVKTQTLKESFARVIDCRGLGAEQSLRNLRAVRGELIHVDAGEVNLSRPIRFLHPRHPIYVVPRPNKKYIIGATLIESQDFRPITVQSTLELLSAAYAVHSGFAEATILETVVHCRPAFADNLPKFIVDERQKQISVNGLYRHGFLISPMLVKILGDYLSTEQVPTRWESLFDFEEKNDDLYQRSETSRSQSSEFATGLKAARL